MKLNNVLLIIFFSILTTTIQAQNCDCTSTFDWVKKTFEENDAGYAYSISVKGKENYLYYSDKIRKQTTSTTDKYQCAKLVRDYLHFFRKGHYSFFPNPESTEDQSSAPNVESDADVIEKYKNTERISFSSSNFENTTDNTSSLEGIWYSAPYKIGIKKINKGYIGFILEADGVYWSKDQVKLKVDENNSVHFFMKDHSERIFDGFSIIGNNHLKIGFLNFERFNPQLSTPSNVKHYLKSITAEKPYLDILNDSTLLLRIPSFDGREKDVIDALLAKNHSLITSTPNLILDIRNNGGGGDRSFKELLPLLYTSPIREIGVEFYSTPLNNARMIEYANDTSFNLSQKEKDWLRTSFDSLNNHLGEFVNLDTVEFSEYKYDTTYTYPEKIGIVINENNGSTTEQFLLAAKQSNKVKLYGTTTYGALDISNMNFIDSPCKAYNFGYCLSKSLRIPHMAIDDKGLQPDYYIDDSIAPENWIDYVMKKMN